MHPNNGHNIHVNGSIDWTQNLKSTTYDVNDISTSTIFSFLSQHQSAKLSTDWTSSSSSTTPAASVTLTPCTSTRGIKPATIGGQFWTSWGTLWLSFPSVTWTSESDWSPFTRTLLSSGPLIGWWLQIFNFLKENQSYYYYIFVIINSKLINSLVHYLLTNIGYISSLLNVFILCY